MSKTKRKLKAIVEPVPAAPIKLDLGCGPNKRQGFTGVDRIQFPGVDVVLNLAETLTEGAWVFNEATKTKQRRLSSGFAEWPWPENSVEEIHCSHTIEHFDSAERVHIFNEMYRIMKPGAKATIIAPHWCSCRAYGDPTHKWPPVSEFLFYYLLKDWRRTQAPHTDAEHWPQGFKCDFDATWGYSLQQDIVSRNQEYQQNALKFWKEAAQDIIATLTKRV